MTPPTWIPGLGYTLEAGVAVLACARARGRVYHWPFAVLALVLAAIDPFRGLLALARDHLGRIHPMTGAPLVAYQIDRISDLIGPIAIGLCAWVVFTGRRWGHLAGAAVLAEVAIVALYPSSRARWVSPAVKLSALLVGWIGAGIWARRRDWADETQKLVLAYLALETIAIVVTTASGEPREAWPEIWIGLLALQVVAIGVQASWIRSREPG